LLVTAQVDPTEIDVGTPLVFVDPADSTRLVIHRVVALAPGTELAFVTQGDANATSDPRPVPARLVRGRVLWHVTLLGTFVEWFQWPRSFLLLVVLPTVVLLVGDLRQRPRSRRARADVHLPSAAAK
jgi:signal peptidase I